MNANRGDPSAVAGPVLVADADPRARRVIAKALGLGQDQVTQATDGRIALALAIGSVFSCLIIDINLPFIDGVSLCELLRRDAATKTTPILILTKDPGVASLRRALRAGANRVLTRPVRPKTLRAEVERLIYPSGEPNEGAGSDPQRGTQDMPKRPSGALPGHRHGRDQDERFATTSPPIPPPALRCPICDRELIYLTSDIGGPTVADPEQWDYFKCPGGCSRFCYAHRTRELIAF